MNNSKPLRLALQKSGRLAEASLELLRKAGIKLPTVNRKLAVKAENFPLEVIFLRASDVIEVVADGVADIGICGQNTVWEDEREIQIIRELGFSRCRLALALPKNIEQNISAINGKTIATGYPNTTKKWLEKQNITANIVPMQGSVEIAPELGIADSIVDLVSSGSTLAANRLVEIATIFQSQAVLITAQKEQSEVFKQLLLQLDSVLKAKNLKSIIMNAPKSAVEQITEILPGLNSPTVMPLAKTNWVAINSVVPEDDNFWQLIQKLQQAGATGILVQPIERVIF